MKRVSRSHMVTETPSRDHTEKTQGARAPFRPHGYGRRAKSAKERTLGIGRKAVSVLASLGQNAAEPGLRGQLAAGADSSPQG